MVKKSSGPEARPEARVIRLLDRKPTNLGKLNHPVSSAMKSPQSPRSEILPDSGFRSKKEIIRSLFERPVLFSHRSKAELVPKIVKNLESSPDRFLERAEAIFNQLRLTTNPPDSNKLPYSKSRFQSIFQTQFLDDKDEKAKRERLIRLGLYSLFGVSAPAFNDIFGSREKIGGTFSPAYDAAKAEFNLEMAEFPLKHSAEFPEFSEIDEALKVIKHETGLSWREIFEAGKIPSMAASKNKKQSRLLLKDTLALLAHFFSTEKNIRDIALNNLKNPDAVVSLFSNKKGVFTPQFLSRIIEEKEKRPMSRGL